MKDIKFKSIMRSIVIVVVCATICFVTYAIRAPKEVDASNEFIMARLESASELTSSKLVYNGLVRYSEGEIPFLTKKEFNMVYRAELAAGIDLSKVEIKTTNNQVIVSLPEVKVHNINIDEDSIEFYDEKFALFNFEKKEDSINAMKIAKEDIKKQKEYKELKANAKNNAIVVVETLLEDAVGNKELIVK